MLHVQLFKMQDFNSHEDEKTIVIIKICMNRVADGVEKSEQRESQQS